MHACMCVCVCVYVICKDRLVAPPAPNLNLLSPIEEDPLSDDEGSVDYIEEEYTSICSMFIDDCLVTFNVVMWCVDHSAGIIMEGHCLFSEPRRVAADPG